MTASTSASMTLLFQISSCGLFDLKFSVTVTFALIGVVLLRVLYKFKYILYSYAGTLREVGSRRKPPLMIK